MTYINNAYTHQHYINSVSHLAEILKQAIENEQQLLQEIKMPYKELQIDMVGIHGNMYSYYHQEYNIKK